MGRTAWGDSDRRLLDAARAILHEGPVSDLKLRDVARRAGVNLGLFHYHFGSKAEFKRRLFQEIYEEFFSKLRLESQLGAGHAERLHNALLAFGRFARDNRRLFLMILSQAMQGERACVRNLQANVPRHVAVVSELIAGGQRAGDFRAMPLSIALSFALGGMGFPNLVAGAMERFGARLPFSKVVGGGEFLSDAALELRASMIVAGLCVPARRRRK